MASAGGNGVPEPLVCGDSLGDVADGVAAQALGVGQNQSQRRAATRQCLRSPRSDALGTAVLVNRNYLVSISCLDQVGLMCDQLISIDVQQRGFDVVLQVFEQEVIAALDEAKVEVVGCLDDVAICNREVLDGVLLC